ncbi:MAG: hypothetical protein RB191_19935 [Terriglobia bacterium]|nr:hypothetical protein [Terriglobia bacterium]
MSDPIWRKVHELTKDYNPHFNAAAAYDLVKAAWRMGFDVVRAAPGSDLYNAAMQEIGIAMRNSGSNGMADNMNALQK